MDIGLLIRLLINTLREEYNIDAYHNNKDTIIIKNPIDDLKEFIIPHEDSIRVFKYKVSLSPSFREFSNLKITLKRQQHDEKEKEYMDVIIIPTIYLSHPQVSNDYRVCINLTSTEEALTWAEHVSKETGLKIIKVIHSPGDDTLIRIEYDENVTEETIAKLIKLYIDNLKEVFRVLNYESAFHNEFWNTPSMFKLIDKYLELKTLYGLRNVSKIYTYNGIANLLLEFNLNHCSTGSRTTKEEAEIMKQKILDKLKTIFVTSENYTHTKINYRTLDSGKYLRVYISCKNPRSVAGWSSLYFELPNRYDKNNVLDNLYYEYLFVKKIAKKNWKRYDDIRKSIMRKIINNYRKLILSEYDYYIRYGSEIISKISKHFGGSFVDVRENTEVLLNDAFEYKINSKNMRNKNRESETEENESQNNPQPTPSSNTLIL